MLGNCSKIHELRTCHIERKTTINLVLNHIVFRSTITDNYYLLVVIPDETRKPTNNVKREHSPSKPTAF